MAWPFSSQAATQGAAPANGGTSAIAGTPLGVSFVNVGKDAGLNTKFIFGGEHKNKYLLETTGCGAAFYDYDNDGWLDIFLVMELERRDFRRGRSRRNECTRIIVAGHLRM